jgi:hypothetical protein
MVELLDFCDLTYIALHDIVDIGSRPCTSTVRCVYSIAASRLVRTRKPIDRSSSAPRAQGEEGKGKLAWRIPKERGPNEMPPRASPIQFGV